MLFQIQMGAGMLSVVVPVGLVSILKPSNKLLIWGTRLAATKGQNFLFMGKMGLFRKRIAMAMIPGIYRAKGQKMTRTISISQAKSMIRQMQNKQRQAVNQYNQAVRDYNRKVEQAVNRYNQELNRISRG
jgi:hypothetical protein